MSRSDFLTRMATGSAQRVVAARARVPERELRSRIDSRPRPRPVRWSAERFDLIAEVKRRSPAAGRLASDGLGALDETVIRGVSERAALYAQAGAAAISVLTEPDAFDGALEHLEAAAASGVPVMRKDFIVDPYQLLEARACGASGVLVIVRLVDDERLGELLDAARELRLFVLLEAFDSEDLLRAGDFIEDESDRPEGVLLGLNARDLTSLAIDRERFATLAPAFPPRVRRVAESGLLTSADAAQVASLGYDVALVGSALMTAFDPEQMIRAMLAAGRRARRVLA